jgi:hypothetical protein
MIPQERWSRGGSYLSTVNGISPGAGVTSRGILSLIQEFTHIRRCLVNSGAREDFWQYYVSVFLTYSFFVTWSG